MELRPHNKKAYDNLIRMYKSGTKSAAIIHPTGTGKTYITMQLVEDHPNENIIIVAPTNAIIDQYKKRFEENGIDVSNVTFLTYTKVMNMNDEELEMEYRIECALFIFYEDLTGLKDIQIAITEMMKIIKSYPDTFASFEKVNEVFGNFKKINKKGKEEQIWKLYTINRIIRKVIIH